MEKLTKVTLSVGEVVDLLYKRGDLSYETSSYGQFRAQRGMDIHQELTSKLSNDEKEISVKKSFVRGEFEITLRGRIDALKDNNLWEIKSTGLSKEDFLKGPYYQALAQAKLYAFLLAPNFPTEIKVLYVQQDSGEVIDFVEKISKESIEEFGCEALSKIERKYQKVRLWENERKKSLKKLKFPFKNFRAGQWDMSAKVFSGFKEKSPTLVEAPTGIGKTLGSLFPSLKFMGTKKIEKILYLTAKNSGRESACSSLDKIIDSGAKIRAIELTAKSKICFKQGSKCTADECPYAKGYFDKVDYAIGEIERSKGVYRRSDIEKIALKYEVCPFELSLDAMMNCDVIVGDYNYVFDPSVKIKRLAKINKKNLLLIDEFHNMPDRARNIYSMKLTSYQFKNDEKEMKGDFKNLANGLRRFRLFLKKKLVDDHVQPMLPLNFEQELELLLENYQKNLSDERFNFEWLTLFFDLRRLSFLAEVFDQNFRFLLKPQGRAHLSFGIWCLDASELIKKEIESFKGSTSFSATLRPFEQYSSFFEINDENKILSLRSPFPQKNLEIFLHKTKTTYNHRENTKLSVGDIIVQTYLNKMGNYFVFFPSYTYLDMVFHALKDREPELPIEMLPQGSSEKEVSELLEKLDLEKGRLIFSVYGGPLNEGVDLVGEKLIGCILVGTGLPQLSDYRREIQKLSDSKGENGFDQAFTYPGLTKVFQAAGRVIRDERDRGTVTLIDERFSYQKISRNFPEWWEVKAISSLKEYSQELRTFWN